MDLTIKDGPICAGSGPNLAQSEPFVPPHGNSGFYLTDA